MANSNRTTKFGPRVSFGTTKADAGPVHVAIPSDGTLSIGGVAGLKFSTITTASAASTFIPDGFIALTGHSANSLVIAIRSGVTTYTWANSSGGVL